MKAPLALLAATAAVASAGGAPAAGQPRFSTIYNFTDGFPLAISRIGGVIYGAFQKRVNSFYTCGLVFSLEPSSGVASGEQWKETVLYHFPDSGDACEPTTAPIPGQAVLCTASQAHCTSCNRPPSQAAPGPSRLTIA